MLMMRIGEVGAVGTTDVVAMGYYLVKSSEIDSKVIWMGHEIVKLL